MSASKLAKTVKDTTFGMGSRVLLGTTLLLLLAGGCGTWAATSTLSGAVIAPGLLRVDQHVKELQHRDGGIIAEIAVRAGDAVKAGQMLIRLDDVQIRAEQQIILSELRELEGRRARLQAERDNLPAIVFPASFNIGNFSEIIDGERQLFDGNRLGLKRRTEQLELQIGQIDQERTALNSQLDALSAELALVEDERLRMQGLVAQNLVESSKMYTLEREVTRMLGQKGEIEANIARANGRASEVRLQMIAIDETARNDAQRELRTLDARISELDERRIAVEDRLSRIEIRSPIDGTINELAVHTIGGVITSAETVATIVPFDAKLTVEVKLATIDVDQVSPGQGAKLRFTAFNQRTTPEIDGEVIRIAAAATRDPATGLYFYLGELAITGDTSVLGGTPLLPGMPVEVFVQTQEQTALSYFAKPFTDQVARAFREE